MQAQKVMVKRRRAHSAIRGIAAVAVLVLLAGVPFSDSPDFALNTVLSGFDPSFDESPDFALNTVLSAFDPSFGESGPFSLDTRLSAFDPSFAESADFALDTRLTAFAPAFAESGSFPLDTRGLNRVWADSGGFVIDDDPTPPDDVIRLRIPWDKPGDPGITTASFWVPQTYDTHTSQGANYAVDFYPWQSGGNQCSAIEADTDCDAENPDQRIRAAHSGWVTLRERDPCSLHKDHRCPDYTDVEIVGTDFNGVDVKTVYRHLLVGAVSTGMWVDAGTVIGTNHRFGCARRAHLMFEVFGKDADEWERLPLHDEKVLLDGDIILDDLCWTTPGGSLGTIYRYSAMPRERGILVSPGESFESDGYQYGPFEPASRTYRVRNIGTTAIEWTAGVGGAYFTLSETGGTLGPGQERLVTVSVDQGAAAGLPSPHVEEDVLTFTNETNGRGNTTRALRLEVLPTQPEDDERTEGLLVTIDHLWQWDEAGGRFAHPGELGQKGVIIDPTKPTYLLTHGWDGELDGALCGNLPDRDGDERKTCADLGDSSDKPAFAMSSIGAAIFAATKESNGSPGVNLLAWDWAERANPNRCCDIPDLLAAPLDVLTNELDRLGQAAREANMPLALALSRDVNIDLSCNSCDVRAHCILRDAFRSGLRAKSEGEKLGLQLGAVLDNGASLGSELHFIGKSHGGGVLGEAAKTLKTTRAYEVSSLTTLDTPVTITIPGQGPLVNSLSYVDPTMSAHTAVYYYSQTLSLSGRALGFGAPIRSSALNLTNLSLAAQNAPEGTAFRPTILHLWIAGKDDCECSPPWSPGACPPDDGWYPVSVWDSVREPPGPWPLHFQASTAFERPVLDVGCFPNGIWLEGGRNVFGPTGACCVPLPLGGRSTCKQVPEDECGFLSVFLGNQTVCLGGLIDPACNPDTVAVAEASPSDDALPGMSLIRYEPFESAATWFGNDVQLVIDRDPKDPSNRVILMEEQGDASFFKDIEWAADAAVLSFDYLFLNRNGSENLTVYVGDDIAYYDNADVSLARGGLTSSGAIYVGHVAGTTAQLNFVFRTDEPEGGEFGGELLLDNVRVYGFRPGDVDLDGARDLFDVGVFQNCYGRGVEEGDELPPECWTFDMDGNGVIDLIDWVGDADEDVTGFVDLLDGPWFPPIP